MNGSATLIELTTDNNYRNAGQWHCMPDQVQAVFTITAAGQNLGYAWDKNGLPVGGNSNILTINNAGMADNLHNIVLYVTSTLVVVILTQLYLQN